MCGLTSVVPSLIGGKDKRSPVPTQTPPAPSPGRLWGPPANDHGDLSSTLLPLVFTRPAVSPEITLILLSVYGPCWWVGPLVFVTEDKGLHTYECSTLKPGWFFF